MLLYVLLVKSYWKKGAKSDKTWMKINSRVCMVFISLLPPCHLHEAVVFLRRSQSPSCHEIPGIVWKAKVHYRVYKIPQVGSILIYVNLVRNHKHRFFKTEHKTIFPSLKTVSVKA
jgi:hypothetical protein